MKHHYLILFSISLILLSLVAPISAQAQSVEATVRAVLFYSPTCPHCAKVIQEDLPPLLDKYPTQLEIIGVDVSTAGGAGLYQAAIEYYQIPQERLGVPTMIIDTTVLVGSGEIPVIFPGLVEHYLSQGGVDWPGIPGLSEAMDSQAADPPEEHPTSTQPAADLPAHPSATLQEASAPEATSNPPTIPAPTKVTSGLIMPEDHNISWQDKFASDPAGNTLSVIVLVGMLGALAWTILYFTRKSDTSTELNVSWGIPLLSLVGLFAAGYLAYVETAQISAVCGPVGDCNTVQQSQYAYLFGILPIGVLGLVGYVMILAAWLGLKYGRNGVEFLSALVILGMTFAGTLFSIYLTFLEPFVIGATCAWCLTSAILMTVLMLLSLKPGKLAYQRYKNR